jgi:hypothetical protein
MLAFPMLTFANSNAVFGGLQNGTAVSVEASAGAPLWVQWVTTGHRVTTWDNSVQLAEEKKNPPSNPRHRHSYAAETRWRLDGKLVSGGPDGWLFAMLEIGADFFCAPSTCEFTLFGLESKGDNTLLHSFDTQTESAQNAIQALHADHSLSHSILNYSSMVAHSIQINYVYGFNKTAGEVVFFGQGSGVMASGSKLVVQETVASTYVAPLELFYESDGTLDTPYDTPIVYRQIKQEAKPTLAA